MRLHGVPVRLRSRRGGRRQSSRSVGELGNGNLIGIYPPERREKTAQTRLCGLFGFYARALAVGR